jgi:hypothetical protein
MVQTVGNAGAIYARDAFIASGAVDVMRNVMDNAASAAAASVLDVVQSWREQWLSSIASIAVHFRPTIRYRLCEEAYMAVLEGDREKTLYFTMKVCGLSGEYHPFVEMALWEERWRQADDPVAYICRTASNMMKRDWKQENIWKFPRFGHILSLDEPMKGGDPIAYLLPDPHDPFKEIDDWLVIEQALSEANLPPEEVELLIARSMEGCNWFISI